MKLIIERNQREKKGLLGGYKGVAFSLACKLELSPEEKDLVDRYIVGNYTLTYRTLSDGTQEAENTLNGLMAGGYMELEDVATLLHNEEVIKDACQKFKILLEVMKTFGGQEVIEF
ncbi:MAG: hypothetical protein HY794_17100 [Desulfarculus sp.]|nr:hypothetical protein [Desulfarculus sp.]